MTKPVTFTQADVRRAIAGARKAGLKVTGISLETGLILVEDSGGAGVAPTGGGRQADLPPENAPEWGQVET